MKRSLLFCICAALAVLAPRSLGAQLRGGTPQVQVEVVPEVLSVQSGTPLRVALRLSVAPGWHVYWKNPGESGLPTVVQWELPPGSRAASLQWPYPERMKLSSVVVHAYRGEAILLATLHLPPNLPRRAKIAARFGWGVCREVCMPQETRLSFSIPVRDEAPRPNLRWARIAANAGPRLPRSLPGWTLRADRAEKGILLRVIPAEGGRLPRGPLTFFPEDPSFLEAAVSAVPELDRGGLTLHLPGPQTPPRLRGVLVAPSGWDRTGRIRALHVDVPIEAGR